GLTPDEEARFREWVKKVAGAPAAPLSGPPPGFADRPRVRTEPAVPAAAAPRPKPPEAPPVMSRSVPESELDTPPMVPALPRVQTPPRVSAQPHGMPESPPHAAGGVDSSLFEGMQTPSSVPPVAPAVEPVV